ncbi:MAG: dipeptide epimerase [Alphaproteobacteria bacterium]|nr:dipeptide epimerase [Alphaproteobacteria bacterium]
MMILAYAESWPIRGKFTISRGSKTSAEVIVVECHKNGQKIGWGEAVPYNHYGESIAQSLQQIEKIKDKIQNRLTRAELISLMPQGAARNAIDCALWDLESKEKNMPVWRLAGLPEPKPMITAYTISYKSSIEMGQDAAMHAHRPLLKIKLSKEDDLERIENVHKNAPNSKIIVDANEAWTLEILERLAPKLTDLNVVLIEQPLPADQDNDLIGKAFQVPLCADESCRKIEDLTDLAKKYQYINIKLDKTGGLTHAIDFVKEAQRLNLKIMIGCMVATSLSMAPSMLLGAYADFIDLDGPLLLEKDRENAIYFDHSLMYPSAIWG